MGLRRSGILVVGLGRHYFLFPYMGFPRALENFRFVTVNGLSIPLYGIDSDAIDRCCFTSLDLSIPLYGITLPLLDITIPSCYGSFLFPYMGLTVRLGSLLMITVPPSFYSLIWDSLEKVKAYRSAKDTSTLSIPLYGIQ